MSVIMTMEVQGDPAEVERFATENPEKMRAIVDRAVENGIIAHRFYGSGDRIMVADEWPDAESFQRFFAQVEAEVGEMMHAAGISGEPQPTFWRKLDTRDEIGWGS
jgi:transcriptional regulator of NAD metabolism